MIDVSIVIVSWNTREVLRNCLASVFAGAASLNVEVLVVDNASNDGSAEMVRNCFPRATLTVNTENRGFAAANNQAIRTAAGRHILLLNSDTVLLGNVLADSVKYMDEHPQVGVFGCRVLNADSSLQLTCQRYPSVVNCCLAASGLAHLPWPKVVGREQMLDWDRNDDREVDVVSGCYMLVRAEGVQRVGLLDEAFFFCGEEADWCKRFRDGGWQLRFAPIGEIIHIGNVSGEQHRYQRDIMLSEGIIRFHRKHYGVLNAMLAWSILWTFNSSRAMYWTMRALASRSVAAKVRRDHFAAVVREFARAWPRQVPA